MLWEKAAIFILTVALSAAFYLIYLDMKGDRKVIKEARNRLAELSERVVTSDATTRKAGMLLQGYKHFYDCYKSDRPDLLISSEIALRAVIETYADEPCFEFLKEKVDYSEKKRRGKKHD